MLGGLILETIDTFYMFNRWYEIIANIKIIIKRSICQQYFLPSILHKSEGEGV